MIYTARLGGPSAFSRLLQKSSLATYSCTSYYDVSIATWLEENDHVGA